MRAVITGGPSVGKTTIIADLAQRGYTVVEEFATQIIKEGKILPWVDRMGFQQEVLRRQLAAEAALKDYDGPVFLDRGSFDGEAYYINDRLPVPSIFAQLDPSSYHLAFLIDELPFFEKNEVRREDIEFTRQITRVLSSVIAAATSTSFAFPQWNQKHEPISSSSNSKNTAKPQSESKRPLKPPPASPRYFARTQFDLELAR